MERFQPNQSIFFPFRIPKIILSVICFLTLGIGASHGQITVNQASTSAQVEALVEDVLLGSCVTVSNVNYIGPASASGTFNAAGTTFSMQSGILLTTGRANVAIGPDNDNDAGVNQGTGGDANLTSLAGVTTYDAVILEFDFVPQDDSLSFRYVFASEEYPEWVNSQYNDVFGFFISGPGISGPYIGGSANIALIPGTPTPVAINNVNNGHSNSEPATGPCTNCAYYVENGSGPDVQYDGYTTVLTAQAVVTPCETYHIRLAIADAGDHIYDSGVFLEAGSFTSGGGITVDFTDVQIEEGCSNDYIVFSRVDQSNNSTPIGATYSIGGTATAGTDYNSFPTSVVIPAGQDTVMIPIVVPLDFIVEGTETIIVYMDQPPCNCLAPGFATINVIDNDIPLALTTTGETTICLGQSANLTANVSGSLPPYSGSWNNGAPAGANVSVSPSFTTTYTYTVTDACGSQTQSSSETITVIRPDFDVVGQNEQCFVDNQFSFSNTGTSGGSVTHYWTFGDGNSSTNENPSHSFGSAGTYTVTHYVIYTAANCTTDASATVTVFPQPEITATVDQNVICAGGTDGAISTSVTGGTPGFTYSWSPGGETSANLSGIGVGTYTVTVTDSEGCIDTDTETITQIDAVDPTAACLNITIQLNGSGNASIVAADVDGGSTDNCGIASISASPLSFTCSDIGANSVTLTVSDVNGNSASCTATVTVEDNVNPSITCPPTANLSTDAGLCTSSASIGTPTSSDNCGIASEVVDINGPYSVGTTTVTWTATDVNGNTATCTQDVIVSDDENPTITCPPTANLGTDAGLCTSSASIGTPTSTDNCGIASEVVDINGPYSVGTTTVTWTATDVNGNTATCSQDVVVSDDDNPSITCPPTANLGTDAGLCTSSASIGNPTSTDNCGIASEVVDISGPYSVGTTTVTWTATDANGNTATCSQDVNVSDDEDPSANCQDITVQLDGNGNATITASQIDNSSSDNCGIDNISASTTNFDCSNVGSNTVTLTVTDVNGNVSTCNATVTVEDNVNPTAVCQNITVQLDGSGNASIIASDIDGGSTDNCGVASLSASETSFDCSNVGPNTVTLTVTDINGNTSTCDATVTVEDNVDPTAVCQNITVQLDGSGNASIAAADIDGGSSDNCGVASLSASETSFDCANVGSNTVTLTVTDVNGNTSTCDATVTVEDNVDPTAVCQDITVQLDASGNVSITAGDIDNGSSDNCGIASLSIDIDSFDCSNEGANTVVLTVTDVNGNSSTCSSTVTVENNILPTVACQDITVQLDANGMVSISASDVDAGSNAACGIASLTVNPSSFDCSNVGTNTVTLTGTDNSGNTSSCTATVTVEDNIDPNAICQNITVQLDGSGNASIVAADIDGGSSDNCGVASLSASETSFDCANVGANTVTLTVTDVNGNTSTCDATVTVEDNVNPTAVCQNVTVQLDASGVATISASDVDGGSSDNCADWDISIDQSSFNCANLGANTVTLTIDDVNGNSASCTATVTVEDNIDPTLIGCPSDINVTASSNDCSPSVNWTEPTADDNCSATITSTHNPGDNFPVGTTTVTYTTTDPSGNSVSCSFDVTINPNQLSVSITPSTVQCGANISCNGETDGDATANVSGGCEPYSYLWSDGQTTQTATGLGAGTYSVTITDANGTQITESVTLTEPDPLVIDGSEVSEYVGGASVSCNGASDGAIEISVVGGSTCEPYAILWTGPNGFSSTDEDILDLEAGTYTVTITDLNGCSVTETFTLTEPDGLSPTCTSEDALCNGDANGSVEVSVTGGTSPYSYSWNNGNPSSSQSGLSAGTYVVTVTDANGCTTTCNSVVGQPNPLTAVVIVQDETIVNGCNGWATANPSGGTPPYSYEWSDGQTTQTAINLCAGTYTVTVTDANECEFTTSNVINPPSCDLDVDVTGTDVSCNDGSDGTATATPITVQNNTPFTYLWNNGETTQTISGLTAGPYTVVVTDSIGCEASGSVVVSEPTALSVSTVVVDEQTFEGCDGSATANPSGGTPPYSYDWSDGQTTQTSSDLCPGTYTVTVTDANGCTETVTITVNPLLCTGFSVAINTQGLSCFQSGDGNAIAVVTGGTAPFTYSWNNGGTTDSIGGLAAGQYTITVTDAVNCTQTVSGNVTQPALLEAATAVDNVTCHGVANGVVELTVTGGTTPYVFNWDNGATTEDLENVGPGTYNVSITDAHGCTTTASGTVTEPDTLSVTSVDINPTCFEGNDGSIDITVTGGLGPYLASWDNGANTLDISNLSAGTYTATIVDQNGCIYTYSTTLADPNQVTATITASGPTAFCEGDSVVLTSSTASTYLWSPNGETTQSIVVYESGNYSVVVADQNGCVGESIATAVTVFEVDPATITADGPTEFCAGERVALIASEGSSYLWSPNGETTQLIFANTSGYYSVTVTDENGCSSTSDSVQVIVNPLPQVDITPNGPTEFCEGGSVTLTSSAADSYFWFPNGETTQSITVTESGNYGVAVVDLNGCGNESQFVNVTLYDNPNPVITADGPTEFCEGGSVILTSTSADSYAWNPNGETTQSITVSASGTYSVVVTDANGCSGESNSISVDVLESDTASVTVNGSTTFCEGGSVTLTSSEGDAYLWSPNGETSQSIVVTESGSYSVVVTNQSGCFDISDTVDVTVNPTPDPVITANGPTEFCQGDSVTLTSSVGDSYLWQPNGEITQSITVSQSGNYSVTITDNNGCSGTSDAITVTEFIPDPATITPSGPTTFCEGKELALLASQGSSYLWSPNGETWQVLLTNTSGAYSVAVTDENGCVSYSDTIIVVVNPNPNPTITSNGPLSFCDGDSVTLSTGVYDEYDWSPNGESGQSITVSEAGDFWVTVTDSNGCSGTSDTVSVEIFTPDTVVITANGSTEFCDGGSVVLTSSQGSSYLWSPNGETTQSITVSASGQYSVTVVDANGCSSTSASVDVVVNPNPTPTITANGPTSFCEGESVTLTSSTADSYLWSPNGEITQSITVSEAGSYAVTVTDSNGCSGTSASTNVVVFLTPTTTITANGPTEFCDGESVVLTSSSASSYLWSPNGETTQSITVTESGTYSVTVVDANGCEGESAVSVDVTVFEPTVPTVTADGPTTFCDGGEVTLTASSGSGYSWSPNGETTQSITVTESGSYVVTVTDENGCSAASASVDVNVLDIPNPNISASGATTFCEGDSVVLTAPNSIAYLWEPDGQTTQSITVFDAGLYSVQVADANTCVGTSDTVEVEIFEVIPAQIQASGPTAFCDGNEVSLTATGGQSFVWSPNGEQSQSITVSEAGEYTVTVLDQNGCSSSSDTTDVTVYELPSVTVTANGPMEICEGDTMTLVADATPTNVDYQWYDNGQSLNGETDLTLEVTSASDYSVTVTDENGCESSSVAPTTFFGPPPVAVVSEDQWVCSSDSILLTASGGESYLWSTGETTSSIMVAPDSVTVYTVTVSNQICPVSSTDSVVVGLYPSPNAVIDMDSTGALEVVIPFEDGSGDNSIVYWQWDFGDGNSTEEQNTQHIYHEEGFFTVVLTVENEYGCADMDTVEIEITQIIDIPNVFTPNDDGINDYVFIDNFGVIDYELTIYDRWGLVMHHDESGEIFWDGKTPAGVDASPGTYYYILKVKNSHSLGDFEQTGTITLLR